MTRYGLAVLPRQGDQRSLAAGAMSKADRKCPGAPRSPAAGKEEEGVDKAFDLWLQRGLHQLYDTVAKEPIPEDLLRLIEDDRTARKD